MRLQASASAGDNDSNQLDWALLMIQVRTCIGFNGKVNKLCSTYACMQL
jgi:hypothetical protein